MFLLRISLYHQGPLSTEMRLSCTFAVIMVVKLNVSTVFIHSEKHLYVVAGQFSPLSHSITFFHCMCVSFIRTWDEMEMCNASMHCDQQDLRVQFPNQLALCSDQKWPCDPFRRVILSLYEDHLIHFHWT